MQNSYNDQIPSGYDRKALENTAKAICFISHTLAQEIYPVLNAYKMHHTSDLISRIKIFQNPDKFFEMNQDTFNEVLDIVYTLVSVKTAAEIDRLTANITFGDDESNLPKLLRFIDIKKLEANARAAFKVQSGEDDEELMTQLLSPFHTLSISEASLIKDYTKEQTKERIEQLIKQCETCNDWPKLLILANRYLKSTGAEEIYIPPATILEFWVNSAEVKSIQNPTFEFSMPDEKWTLVEQKSDPQQEATRLFISNGLKAVGLLQVNQFDSIADSYFKMNFLEKNENRYSRTKNPYTSAWETTTFFTPAMKIIKIGLMPDVKAGVRLRLTIYPNQETVKCEVVAQAAQKGQAQQSVHSPKERILNVMKVSCLESHKQILLLCCTVATKAQRAELEKAAKNPSYSGHINQVSRSYGSDKVKSLKETGFSKQFVEREEKFAMLQAQVVDNEVEHKMQNATLEQKQKIEDVIMRHYKKVLDTVSEAHCQETLNKIDSAESLAVVSSLLFKLLGYNGWYELNDGMITEIAPEMPALEKSSAVKGWLIGTFGQQVQQQTTTSSSFAAIPVQSEIVSEESEEESIEEEVPKEEEQSWLDRILNSKSSDKSQDKQKDEGCMIM